MNNNTKSPEMEKLPITKDELKYLLEWDSDRIKLRDMHTKSTTSKDFQQLLCDGGLVSEFVMCKRCRTLIGYSKSRGWNRMNCHLDICQAKAPVVIPEEMIPKMIPKMSAPKSVISKPTQRKRKILYLYPEEKSLSFIARKRKH